MPSPADPTLLADFRQALVDCRDLYVSASKQCIAECPDKLPREPQTFRRLMYDLHHGLLVKVYAELAEADRRWDGQERLLAEILFHHVWGKRLEGAELERVGRRVMNDAADLTWYGLIKPFDRLPPLRERVAELETVVLRVANLTAKADGRVSPEEERRLRHIQQQIDTHLRPIPLEDAEEPSAVEDEDGRQALQAAALEGERLHEKLDGREEAEEPDRSPEERLEAAYARLDALIGLDEVKREVRTLANFLQMQQQREAAGLPRTPLSLHMVFNGNPGTGKTTLARIVGEIFAGMGVLEKGHLIETDRSGLVAQYSGQTGPKVNKKIDEALDGVLFIDEAYSLAPEAREDPYGQEAVQALLKRMEDERERLVVILAGYPQPMDRLLKSNPGLSSRFNTHFTFPDYRPGELGRIFGAMCEKNHYKPAAAVQARLLLGFWHLYQHRDEHFGNGRLVRNMFENAIRRMANRIAGAAPLTHEMLTTLEADDIDLPDIPSDVWRLADSPDLPFVVACPGCRRESKLRAADLGKRARCNACQARFEASWGEPCVDEAGY